MTFWPSLSRSTAALLPLVAAALAATPPAAGAVAGAELLVVDGGSVRSAPARGTALAGIDTAPTPPARSRSTATAARALAPKKKAATKPKKPAFNLAVIRRAINHVGGPPTRRYDARAALTAVDRQAKASPTSSQARRELEALLKNTTTMARGNRITADRLPMLTETLKRNVEWWKLRKPTASGQRVTFAGSQLVWQYYAGSGMQVQWLGTFGQGNFLYGSGAAQAGALTQLIDESLRLAVPRAGGIAWEYFFPFGGGSPPWVSGMAQATGIQVLSRSATKLGRPDLLASAKSALAILQTPPPVGVQVVEPSGTHFLLYSFSPGLKVLNAMNQTVNGLYAYVQAAPDDVDGRLLLLDGLRWLDTNLPRFDTGKWGLYSLGGNEATLHYQGVARDFLKTLCSLLKTDAVTPGGGPSGAYPSTRICAMADTFTQYLNAR